MLCCFVLFCIFLNSASLNLFLKIKYMFDVDMYKCNWIISHSLGDTHLITPYTWLSTSQQFHSAFKMFFIVCLILINNEQISLSNSSKSHYNWILLSVINEWMDRWLICKTLFCYMYFTCTFNSLFLEQERFLYRPRSDLSSLSFYSMLNLVYSFFVPKKEIQ